MGAVGKTCKQRLYVLQHGGGSHISAVFSGLSNIATEVNLIPMF